MRMFSINLGGGGSSAGALIGRANSEAIGNGATTVNVVFSSDIGSTNYSIVTAITNTADANPIYPQIIANTKASTGFTAELSAPTDTANYVLEWVAVIHG